MFIMWPANPGLGEWSGDGDEKGTVFKSPFGNFNSIPFNQTWSSELWRVLSIAPVSASAYCSGKLVDMFQNTFRIV